ncbi:hypothetical protein [Streptomyces sp. D2-8]|uniref:hypothetical protein n=1 Tax=Streptomyces sp. D2-8 TaxID=2707767 RepID=UPI0020C00C1F|nr:hypothetical protein [Streptomyces sp. D2-8]
MAGTLGGGLLGVAGTLITTRGTRKAAREAARTDHAKWLRDRRVDVFKEVSRHAQQLVTSMEDGESFASLAKDFDRLVHEVRLVGPRWLVDFADLVAFEAHVVGGLTLDVPEHVRESAKGRLPSAVAEMADALGDALEDPERARYPRPRFVPLSEADGISFTPNRGIVRVQMRWLRKKDDLLWLFRPWRQIAKTLRGLR